MYGCVSIHVCVFNDVSMLYKVCVDVCEPMCVPMHVVSFVQYTNLPPSQHVEEQIKLLRHQRRLEDELGESFVDMSLQATLHKLTLQRAYMSAEKLRKEFKVPDKRYNRFIFCLACLLIILHDVLFFPVC